MNYYLTFELYMDTNRLNPKPIWKKTKENCIAIARIMDFIYSYNFLDKNQDWSDLALKTSKFRCDITENRKTKGFIFPDGPFSFWKKKFLFLLNHIFKTEKFIKNGFLFIKGEDNRNPREAYELIMEKAKEYDFSEEEIEIINDAAIKSNCIKDYFGEYA